VDRRGRVVLEIPRRVTREGTNDSMARQAVRVAWGVDRGEWRTRQSRVDGEGEEVPGAVRSSWRDDSMEYLTDTVMDSGVLSELGLRYGVYLVWI